MSCGRDDDFNGRNRGRRCGECFEFVRDVERALRDFREDEREDNRDRDRDRDCDRRCEWCRRHCCHRCW